MNKFRKIRSYYVTYVPILHYSVTIRVLAIDRNSFGKGSDARGFGVEIDVRLVLDRSNGVLSSLGIDHGRRPDHQRPSSCDPSAGNVAHFCAKTVHCRRFAADVWPLDAP